MTFCFQGAGQVEFTSVVYAGDSTLYVSSSTGQLSAWDTRHNTCFLHWEADSQEIGNAWPQTYRITKQFQFSISKHSFDKRIHRITVYDVKYCDSQESSFKA